MTDWVAVTADAVALKLPLLEPAGTVTAAGTCKELLLLESDTFTVLSAAPVRYTEQAFVAGPVSVAVPHDMLLRLTVLVVASGYNVITSVLVTPDALPVIVTRTCFVTADETTSKPVDVAPAATVTADGTFNAELLLVKLTFVEPLAAALRYTEHAFD